jgi:hypothetical protein
MMLHGVYVVCFSSTARDWSNNERLATRFLYPIFPFPSTSMYEFNNTQMAGEALVAMRQAPGTLKMKPEVE